MTQTAKIDVTQSGQGQGPAPIESLADAYRLLDQLGLIPRESGNPLAITQDVESKPVYQVPLNTNRPRGREGMNEN